MEQLRRQRACTTRLAWESIALDAGVEPLLSKVGREPRTRATGFGDTVIGGQWVMTSDSPAHPAVAAAYHVKLPTASTDHDLGTGRFDHRLELLVSKNVGDTDIDANVSYVNVGQQQSGRASGDVVAVSASREFRSNFGYVGEVSHQSEDAEAPRGTYALAAVTYRLNERARLA